MGNDKNKEKVLFECGRQKQRIVYIWLFIIAIGFTAFSIWVCVSEPMEFEDGDLIVAIVMFIEMVALWCVAIIMAIYLENYRILVTENELKVRKFLKERVVDFKDIDWVHTDPQWDKGLSNYGRSLAKYLLVTISYDNGKIIKVQIPIKDTERFYRLVWHLANVHKNNADEINNISNEV